jgi:hypothetical protein
MEQSKTAIKGRATKKPLQKKASPINTQKEKTLDVISTNGLNLTLDKSLSKYAKDPFILEQVEIANRKFSQHKS